MNDTSPIRSAERYWRSLSSETRLPSHRDIDPIKIGPATLPHVALIDVFRDDDTRFRYQLLGGAVIQIFAQDYTNRFIDELGLGEVFDRISGFYGTVCVGRQPLLLDGAYERRKGSRF
ncbi:MAG: PAS domain-containing protein [Pseudomonadota bacterium]|nr:PAS domain-containing protein [Pseudomonadota bacterium]MEC7539234.1 PAS domain-containing protein [Pseudomonadota bacterium]MEC8370336.1 PAS domain-containing protein [Pseudomonadota bacterium]MEC8699031.1 PAS domain-containing protein [Pseudomonadota bacterium]MEC9185643.1 PAS domain-containing protein [Pseudomonadota bacterium]